MGKLAWQAIIVITINVAASLMLNSVHNLVRLVNGSGLSELITEEQQLFIDQMTPLNIEARYPEYKEALLSALSESKCREIIDNTKNLKLWIESLL
ncbi:MAG: HEPN domain-containing protein [Prevotellaceae bacterium]|nr:HEPN domain-containing protein [Candidatus Minthosoma caballi]